jgi:tRNA threonylcarbamoyladenosine biosynthesis protein TsaB
VTEKTEKGDRTAEITLAIETAAGGGSLSLLAGEEELAGLAGEAGISKAEEVLKNLEALLKIAGLGKRDVRRIAVSEGPGSLTGIRIGLATAKGLGAGLGVPYQIVSLPRALMLAAEPGLAAAILLATGRDQILCRYINPKGPGGADSETMPLVDLERRLEKYLTAIDGQIVVTGQLAEIFGQKQHSALLNHPSVLSAGENLAKLVGRRNVRDRLGID